jgi:DNA primase
MKYSEFVQDIDVEAVEEELGLEAIEVKKSESRHYCPLPNGNHNNGDTSGKFYINRDMRVYNCWVCGGGNLVSLVCEMKDISPEDAIEWLWGFTRPRNQSTEQFKDEIMDILSEDDNQEDVLPHYSERVLSKYQNNHHSWFEERHISDSVKEQYGVCFAPDAKRYGPDRETYEGPSIIIPHFWQERLVGWQNRWLSPSRPKWVPKYTNTPDLPKKHTLFGWDQVKDEQDVPLIIVESAPTVLFLASQGLPAVATFGASVSEEQIAYLRRFQSGIIIAPDNDAAGAHCAYELSSRLDKFIPVMQLPPVTGSEGSDLGDLEPSELKDFFQQVYLV